MPQYIPNFQPRDFFHFLQFITTRQKTIWLLHSPENSCVQGVRPQPWSPNHHPVTVNPAAKNQPQRSGYVNERKFYTLMQESGIEKDDLQTMFNVLDSDDSGEVHVFLVGKSWRKRSGIFVLIFLHRFFVFVLDWEGRGRSWGVGWLWIGSCGFFLTAEGERDVIYCTRRAEKQAT